jgi:hypothetical protein
MFQILEVSKALIIQRNVFTNLQMKHSSGINTKQTHILAKN